MATAQQPFTPPSDPIERRRFLCWLSHGLPLIALPVGALLPTGCSKVEGTGRTQFAWIPHSQMVALSDQAFEEISKGEQVCTHQPTVAMVQRLGERLNQHAGSSEVQYRFTVFENPDANAFAMPNGQVVVYTGILKYCGTEAALAAIVGHEIAHVVARHGNERMTQQLGLNVALSLADVGLGAAEVDGQTRQLAVGLMGAGGTVGLILPFSRKHESEADHLGAIYLAKAGYDPREAIGFWQRFAAAKSGQPPEWLSTHPHDLRRAKELEDNLDKYLGYYQVAPQQYGVGAPIPEPYRG